MSFERSIEFFAAMQRIRPFLRNMIGTSRKKVEKRNPWIFLESHGSR
ncbi:hypothetical protein LEP1GSC133_4989 [Leptospira borgpetersenii serovar Pomona str. 200901868]|uniref:Uncharacterized protein n=2 Tax=Leptospira borgpetersenii TaxID=174 RepID=M6W428_LEPBO|nr:hypothetical protein LEP1GSC056_0629 [Leptospira borgpetersenii str. Brem 328]EMO62226.1 hypothetical protein LEP1GSC133_4989 [Leptospira borgpetersenii serovar Pomona str. 200901868]